MQREYTTETTNVDNILKVYTVYYIFYISPTHKYKHKLNVSLYFI